MKTGFRRMATPMGQAVVENAASVWLTRELRGVRLATVAEARERYAAMSDATLEVFSEAVAREAAEVYAEAEAVQRLGRVALADIVASEADVAHAEDAEGPHDPATWGEPNEQEPDPRVIPAPGAVPGNEPAAEEPQDDERFESDFHILNH